MNANDYTKQKERALSRKLEMIKIKGGKCEKCGYDKNIAALEFHHLEAKTKKFQLDSRHLSNTSTEKILEELDKCILVCANCHREIHNPLFDCDKIEVLLTENKSKHSSIFSTKKTKKCEYCSKEFEYVKGKKYCSKECREASKGYPSCEELVAKYNELKSWEKVAKHFGITRRITQHIRKTNELDCV